MNEWRVSIFVSVAFGGCSEKETGLYIICLFVVYLMTIVKLAHGTSDGWMMLNNEIE
jgi:hypothetical protein